MAPWPLGLARRLAYPKLTITLGVAVVGLAYFGISGALFPEHHAHYWSSSRQITGMALTFTLALSYLSGFFIYTSAKTLEHVGTLRSLFSDGGAESLVAGLNRIDPVRFALATAVGVVMGSLYYISPEQLVGSRDVDARADIYSLGCVLYEMITGRPPFLGEREAIIKQHMFERPTALPGSVPAALRETVMKALQKRPGERQESAAELVSALSSSPSEASARRRDLTLRLAAVAATLALIAILAVWGSCSG